MSANLFDSTDGGGAGDRRDIFTEGNCLRLFANRIRESAAKFNPISEGFQSEGQAAFFALANELNAAADRYDHRMGAALARFARKIKAGAAREEGDVK